MMYHRAHTLQRRGHEPSRNHTSNPSTCANISHSSPTSKVVHNQIRHPPLDTRRAYACRGGEPTGRSQAATHRAGQRGDLCHHQQHHHQPQLDTCWGTLGGTGEPDLLGFTLRTAEPIDSLSKTRARSHRADLVGRLQRLSVTRCESGACPAHIFAVHSWGS
jgi:hypothetical protein